METIGSYEAKTHLPRLLERVARGERIVITRHGTPVALLVPPEGRRTDPAQTIEKLLAFRRGRRLQKGESIRQMIEEGRRL